jgi:SanA protein
MSWRNLVRWLGWGSAVVVLLLLAANVWVVQSTTSQAFSTVEEVPSNQVAVVLGTSNKLATGAPNPFFQSRMAAAAELYRQGKAHHFILSGDNRTRYYNEPLEMKKALMNQGVPDSAMTLDYAGLRTLDTMVRCKEIFGQDKITIITQAFHSYRALFISRYYQIDAVALMAPDPSLQQGAKVFFREYFARAKAILDLYVLKTAPRHLGQKEPLPL